MPPERLRRYEFDAAEVLGKIAAASGIAPSIRRCASGLWVIGSIERGRREQEVLFAPLGFAADLPAAVEEVRATLHFETAVLLAMSPDTVDGCATQLQDRGVDCCLVSKVLGDDLRLTLPPPSSVLLEVDAVARTAKWKGRVLALGDLDVLVLAKLVRECPAYVAAEDLEWWKRPEDRVADYARKSIFRIRPSICDADDEVTKAVSEKIIKNIRSVGYALTLQPWNAVVLE